VTTEELTCMELVEIVTNYLEGVMPPADVARFEEHLADCEGCTAYLDQMRTTIALTGRLREEDISPAAREELLAVFRDWKSGLTD
jgi:predicted anti-sigma-YlaC factor YlaD